MIPTEVSPITVRPTQLVGTVRERTVEPTYGQVVAQELATYRAALERIARFRNVPVPASVPALIAQAALEGRS